MAIEFEITQNYQTDFEATTECETEFDMLSNPQIEFDKIDTVAGVTSWNQRIGAVMPEVGDYTLGMVGGEILSNSDINDIWGDI